MLKFAQLLGVYGMKEDLLVGRWLFRSFPKVGGWSHKGTYSQLKEWEVRSLSTYKATCPYILLVSASSFECRSVKPWQF